MIQDITGEQNSPSVNQNNSYDVKYIAMLPLLIRLLYAIHWSRLLTGQKELLHKPMAVPLASCISDKIQSKIWANEYIDFGTLLQRSHAIDSKYNFVLQALPSADWPDISLEPARKLKRIATIDQWLKAFQTFVAIYTVQFPNDAPALMKHSETVRDLAAKNAHWRYDFSHLHLLTSSNDLARHCLLTGHYFNSSEQFIMNKQFIYLKLSSLLTYP